MRWSKKNDWFDPKSFLHFGNLALIYGLLLVLFIKSKRGAIILFIVLTLIHIIDDLLNNFTDYSFENLWHKSRDGDSIQNFLGDIISGLLSTIPLLIIYNKVSSLWYILGLTIIFFMIGIIGWMTTKKISIN